MKIDANQFPRIYSIDSNERRGMDAVAFAPLAIVVAVSLLSLVGLAKNVTPKVSLIGGAATGAYAVLLCSWSRRRVVLHEDAIEVSGWLSSRKIYRKDIRGWKTKRLAWQAGGGFLYVIVPADKSLRSLTLPAYLRWDREFHAWMSGIERIPQTKGWRRAFD